MFGLDWLDPNWILNNAGGAALWITAAILFAECGILIGFILPGDTLLFSVGIFTSTGIVDHSVVFVVAVLTIAAFLGNVVGYELGRAIGPPLYQRSSLLREEHIQRSEAFFEKYGAAAIIIARFVPIVRTFITVVAGIAEMNRRKFLTYSGIGAVLWIWSLVLLGYYLGQVQFVRDHIEPHLDLVILAAVVCSVGPFLVHLLLERRKSKRAERSAEA